MTAELQLAWRRFRCDRVAMISAGAIAFLIVVAVAAPLVVGILGVSAPNVKDSSALDSFGRPTGPSGAHPFGVDQLGRDVLSRVIYGARASLEAGILGTAVAVAIGTVVGLLAGFYRGWVDTALSRLVDVLLAFPALVLGLGIGAACRVQGCLGGLIQPGAGTVIFIVAITSFTYIARVVRGRVRSLREQEFVQAARALGASDARILLREILPNLLAPLVAGASLLVPQNILLEAALSYLGVGISPPTSSWGQMISDASNGLIGTAWWYLVFPGVALLLTVLALHLLADGLRDAPHARARRRRAR